MRDGYGSANEKPRLFLLPVSSNGRSVDNSPSKLSLSSIKELSSALISGLALRSQVQDGNSLIFPNMQEEISICLRLTKARL